MIRLNCEINWIARCDGYLCMFAGFNEHCSRANLGAGDNIGQAVAHSKARLTVDFQLSDSIQKHSWARFTTLAGYAVLWQRRVRVMRAEVKSIDHRPALRNDPPGQFGVNFLDPVLG